MRTTPSARIGALTGLLYAPAFVGLLVWSGVAYPDIANDQDSVLRAVLVPQAILAVVLIGLVSWWGWWGPVLRDDRPAPGWLKVIPILFGLAIVGGLIENAAVLPTLAPSLLAVTLVATLLVGFNEELVYRGIAVVGFRASLPEWQVWLFSSLLFAALHAWNAAAGQDLASTAVQVVMTFGIGSVLYLCRRASGTIIVPMLLHGFYDSISFRLVSGVANLALIAMPVVTAAGLYAALRRS